MAGDSLAEMEQQNEGAPDGEMDMDEIQMAIQALSSLKGDPSSASPSSRPARPSEITLPPISTFWSGPPGVGSNGHAANGHSGTGPRHHVHSSNGLPGGLQYSYVTAGDGSGRFGTESNGHHRADMQGPSSSASTSAYTYTPATTPSVLTTTSLSSPGSPSGLDNSAYFRLEEDANDQAQFDLLESRHPTHTHTSMIVRANGQQGQQPGDDGFIGRVSQFPLVSGALRVYERGRNSSRVVKVRTFPFFESGFAGHATYSRGALSSMEQI